MLTRLLQKYAEQPPTALVAPENNIHVQSEQLRMFSEHLQIKLRVLISEMEHDISTLKHRGFDKEMWKMLTGVWMHLVGINQGLTREGPLVAAKKLVDYVRDRGTRAVIDNLDFLAKHHLKKTDVDFTPNQIMVHPEIRSLTLLTSLVDYLENYLRSQEMEDKPATPVTPTTTTPTWRPPRLSV